MNIMEINVKDRQSVADIALQYLGSVEGAFDIADAFGIDVTGIPEGSARLGDSSIIDINVRDFFKKEHIIPSNL